jgi:hypothetical protein
MGRDCMSENLNGLGIMFISLLLSIFIFLLWKVTGNWMNEMSEQSYQYNLIDHESDLKFILEIQANGFAVRTLYDMLGNITSTKAYRVDNKNEFNKKILKYSSDGYLSERDVEKLISTLIDVEKEQRIKEREEAKRRLENISSKITEEAVK